MFYQYILTIYTMLIFIRIMTIPKSLKFYERTHSNKLPKQIKNKNLIKRP